ncbi:MAG TPA: alanine racemase [Lentisphaeria bacterium]|nr:MAG: alanine racemase [Lentisphaerae bacterium GWF2_38_69]HBM16675.1 alanine racemase [Lentisphaeria bacterium]
MKSFLFLIGILSIFFLNILELPGLSNQQIALIDKAIKDKKENKELICNPAFVEICPSIYKKNIEYIKKLIGNDVKICIVMKGDAYGHGIRELIDAAIETNPDYIAAIDNSEFKAISDKLKKKKANIPLLRLVPPLFVEVLESQINDYGVEEIVGSLGEAQMLSELADELSKETGKNIIIPIHINVETGMGRMGMRNIEDMKKVMKINNLKLKGIMTHFAKVYEMEKGLEMTKEQTNKFDEVVKELDLEGKVIRHIANSGATAMYPWTRKDMVRVGSLTYGEDVEGQNPEGILKPVFKSFKSYVAIIENKIPENSPVGYDSEEYTSPNKISTTATVRVGYNNAYPYENAYATESDVLIKGKRFPIIGKTSMNMVVIDITAQDEKNRIQVGDEVVLIGKQGKEKITLEEVANKNKIGITEMLLEIGNLNSKVIAE